jgi:RNA polymerase sigma factor (sigma-70 family)
MVDHTTLIKELQQGDEDAFRELVFHFQDMVVRTAYAYLKDKEEAEDLAQEVFISVYENISSFRNEANLKTWIYRITINKSLNQIRKLKWKSTVQSIENLLASGSIQAKEKSDPYSSLISKEEVENVKRAMEKLPSAQRTAFILHKYDDLSQQEIAQIMSTSVAAVESLVHRAKMNLQKSLIVYKKM